MSFKKSISSATTPEAIVSRIHSTIKSFAMYVRSATYEYDLPNQLYFMVKASEELVEVVESVFSGANVNDLLYKIFDFVNCMFLAGFSFDSQDPADFASTVFSGWFPVSDLNVAKMFLPNCATVIAYPTELINTALRGWDDYRKTKTSVFMVTVGQQHYITVVTRAIVTHLYYEASLLLESEVTNRYR